MPAIARRRSPQADVALPTRYARSFTIPVIAITALAVGFVAAFVTSPEYREMAIPAYLATGVLAIVIMRFFFYGDPRDVLLIIVAGLTYILYFPPLLINQFTFTPTHRFSYDALFAASWYALIGFCALILGYYAGRLLPIRPVLKHIGDYEIAPQRIAGLSTVLMILGLVCIAYRNEILEYQVILGRITFMIDQIPLLAIALGGLAIMNGYRSKAFRIVLFGVFVPTVVLIIVARTLFYHLIVLFIPLFIMYMLRHRRFPVLYAGIVAILLIPAFKARVAERIAHGYLDEATTWELVSTGFESTVSAFDRRDESTAGQQDEMAAARLNSVSLLAHVVMAHQFLGKPFKYGETFWWLPLSPIPRLIFPAKPRNDHSDTFPIEYGIKTAYQKYAVVLPLMVESYINGGIAGLILINLGIGVAYYLISAIFQHGRGTVNMLAMLSVLALTIYVENNITLIFGAALQSILMWFVLDMLGARYIRERRFASHAATRRVAARRAHV